MYLRELGSIFLLSYQIVLSCLVQAENEAEDLRRQIRLVEDDLEQAAEKSTEYQQKAAEMEGLYDDTRRYVCTIHMHAVHVNSNMHVSILVRSELNVVTILFRHSLSTHAFVVMLPGCIHALYTVLIQTHTDTYASCKLVR